MEKVFVDGPEFLNEYYSLFHERIKLIKEYIQESSDILTEKQTKLKKIFDEDIADNPEFIYVLENVYSEDFHKEFRSFPNLVHSSALVSIYSFFEYSLIELCRQIALHYDLKIKIKDLYGENYIDRAIKYFEIILSLDIKKKFKEWDSISRFRKIRNAIVHDNSNIWKERDKKIEDQKYYQIIVNEKEIELNKSNGDFYVKSEKINSDFCDLIDSFVKLILEQMMTLKKENITITRTYDYPYFNGTPTNVDDLPF